MKTLQLAQLVLSTILLSGIGSTTHAFMAVPASPPSQAKVDLANMVDSLRQEVAAGQTKCEDMLAKINGVLKGIDAKLDAGVENEADYLAARSEITKLRYQLECVARRLAQNVIVDDNGMPIGDASIVEGGFIPGGFTPDGFTPGGFPSGGGGLTTNTTSTGRGFSGSAGNGRSAAGSLRGLATAGFITAAAVIPATTDDNSPGIVASEAVAN